MTTRLQRPSVWSRLIWLAILLMLQVNWIHIVLIYIASINVVTFLLYGVDKWKAKRSKWRVSEAALIWLAVFGGSIGAWLGMKAWHHKTLHKKFQYGIPVILLMQVLAIIYLFAFRI